MPESPPTEMGTKGRIIAAGAELLSRRGYAGTGVKAIVEASGAPFGSVYHFFPGGKEELGAAALRASGATFRQLVETFYPAGADVVRATGDLFEGAGAMIIATDYADACPIASVALEIASISEPMRLAAAEAFESWLEVIEIRLGEAGMPGEMARAVAVELFCAIEGAFLLCRTTRSPEALEVAGRAAVARVSAALESTRR